MKRYVLLVVVAAVLLTPCGLQAQKVSAMSGAWSMGTTWVGGVAPVANESVIISSGHIVSIDTSPVVTDLTVAGQLEYENISPTVRTVSVNGLLTIAPSGVFTVAVGSGIGIDNRLNISGNVVNNGQWLMRPVLATSTRRASVNFTGGVLQTLTGTGTTQLQRVIMSKGGVAGVVQASMPVSVSATGIAFFLPIDFSTFAGTGGTWRQTAGTLNFDNGFASSTNEIIEFGSALEIVGSATMIFGQSGTGAPFRLNGGSLLFNTSGADSFIGITSNNALLYNGNVNISQFTLQQGTLRIAGRLSPTNTGDALIFNQTGGSLIINNTTPYLATPSITTRGSFEISGVGSQCTISGGNIIIANANTVALGSRPADMFIATSVPTAISGGLIQFGTGASAFASDFDVPPNAVFNNISIFQGATAQPYATSTALRIAGDLTVNGALNFTTPSVVAGAAVQTLIFQGANSVSQNVSSTPPFAGTITLQNLTMNRQGTGAGVVNVNRGFSIAGVLDFQTGSALTPQILALTSTLGITVTNTAPQAVINGGTGRYVRTSATGGFFNRVIGGAGAYLFPIGSLGSSVNPADTYTPVTLQADAGSVGTMSMRVAPGQSTTRPGGHAQLDPQWQTYLRRVWTVGATTFTGTGQLVFTFPGDWAGGLDAGRVGRYTPNESTTVAAGGAWQTLTTGLSGFSMTGGVFATPAAQSPAALNGDWTIVEAASRLFYSRASGLWRDVNTWSLISHIGSVANLFPSRAQDSVIIGGGTDNVMNHVVALDTNLTIRGLALGTGTGNTGTLELRGEAALSGQYLSMTGFNTLRIGSKDGIAALPDTVTGNIRTTQTRAFAPETRYEYIGSAEQRFGRGLPLAIRSLWVSKTLNTTAASAATPTIPSVKADTNITIRGDLRVASGALDVGTYTLNAQPQLAVATTLGLGAGAVVRFGGSRTFVDQISGSLNGYVSYTIDSTSTVEWYGSAQTIVPSPDALGYGNVIVRGMGTKIVRTAVLARGSVYVREAATLSIARDTGALRVWRDFYNDAILQNDGLLDIGR
jgi:hypothetical protein